MRRREKSAVCKRKFSKVEGVLRKFFNVRGCIYTRFICLCPDLYLECEWWVHSTIVFERSSLPYYLYTIIEYSLSSFHMINWFIFYVIIVYPKYTLHNSIPSRKRIVFPPIVRYIFMFDINAFKHQYSWNFLLPLKFLPVVQIIVKRLLVSEMSDYVESNPISFPYTVWSSCLNISRYLDHYVTLARDICVCSSNYIGRQCLILFDPCTINSCNRHENVSRLYKWRLNW
jgi:hypothetical protein